MSLEEMLDVWKEVRAGLIAELAQIPAEQFGFQATPESRSVAGIIRHIVEAQKFLTGELCHPRDVPSRADKRLREVDADRACAHGEAQGVSRGQGVARRQ